MYTLYYIRGNKKCYPINLYLHDPTVFLLSAILENVV